MFRCAQCGALNRVPGQRPEGTASCGKCHQALELTGAPQSVGAADLARVLASSDVPVVLDFWAPWCGPCRSSAPTYEAIAKSRAGRMLFLKVNTEEAPDVATSYGIRGIPTFVVLSGGRELARRSGAPPRATLESWLDESIGGGAQPSA